jgi:hypothetical protein
MRQINELKISNSQNLSVNKEMILWLESIIKYKLPSSYITFITNYNGGFPELDTFSNESGEWDVNNFFFIDDQSSKESKSPTESVLWNYHNKWDGAKNSIFPFARDGGGNLFCLDLDFGENAPVIFWTHENPTPEGTIIANNFEQFIDNLHFNPDYI